MNTYYYLFMITKITLIPRILIVIITTYNHPECATLLDNLYTDLLLRVRLETVSMIRSSCDTPCDDLDVCYQQPAFS